MGTPPVTTLSQGPPSRIYTRGCVSKSCKQKISQWYMDYNTHALDTCSFMRNDTKKVFTNLSASKNNSEVCLCSPLLRHSRRLGQIVLCACSQPSHRTPSTTRQHEWLRERTLLSAVRPLRFCAARIWRVRCSKSTYRRRLFTFLCRLISSARC